MIFSITFGTREIDGRTYMIWLLPGMLVLNVMAFGLIQSSSAMTDIRQRGMLHRLKVAPVRLFTLIGSYAVVNILICLG